MPSATEPPTKSPRRTRAIALGLAAFAIAAAAYTIWPYRDVPYHRQEALEGRRPLLAARSWHYNLSDMDVDRIAKVTSDVFVVDFAKNEGKEPLSPAEVERMKVGPDGKRRFVISYFSVGEAEEFRFYWRPEWKEKPPSWDAGENCAWPKAHKVRYWQDNWKDIIIRGPNSYLKQIIAAGFDGVYLDRIDVFEHHKDTKLDLRGEMKKLVAEIKSTSTALKPGFFVIAQNAEDLLTERDYRASIDGLGKEDLLYGGTATGERNKEADIAWSVERLNLLLRDYKPVFVVEYPKTREQVAAARAEIVKLGMVPTFQHRSLDGTDPLDANIVRKPGSNVGTPEYIAENCKNKPWW